MLHHQPMTIKKISHHGEVMYSEVHQDCLTGSFKSNYVALLQILFSLLFLSCHNDEKEAHKKLTACVAQGQTYLKMTCSLMWPTGLKVWRQSFKT